MSRYIDANELVKKIQKDYNYTGEEIIRALSYEEYSPTVDAEPVVRCKDCEYAHVNENHPSKPLICGMTLMCGTTEPENYCWQGVKRGTVKYEEEIPPIEERVKAPGAIVSGSVLMDKYGIFIRKDGKPIIEVKP